MRNLKLLCTVMLLSAAGFNLPAQNSAPLTEPDYAKSKLFLSLPENIKVDINTLKSLLKSSNGDEINSELGLNAAFRFSGQVVSTASKYDNTIQSIVIRSENFNGARLTFTQITGKDGSMSYTGRIISLEHGDAYELKLIDGNYEFVKRKLYDLLNE